MTMVFFKNQSFLMRKFENYMAILTIFNANMERFFLILVIHLLILSNFSQEYEFNVNEYDEILPKDVPLCKCEESGFVRPNVLLYNDKE